jgi:hypothetical protein
MECWLIADDKNMNASLAKLLVEGLFYIRHNSSGPIKFVKVGDKTSDDDVDKDAKVNTTGASTTGPGATATGGVRKLLQQLSNATGSKGNATTGAVWQLSGSLKNWKVDGVQILVHDVITKNGVMHVCITYLFLFAGAATGRSALYY